MEHLTGEELVAFIKEKYQITEKEITFFRETQHTQNEQQRAIFEKGTLPNAEKIANVGSYFTFMNREISIEIMYSILKEYYGFMKDIHELKAAKREFALVGGASGTGKTTFVEAFSLLYKNVIKEKDEFDKELKELIGDYIQKITINLNEMPLEYFELNQKEMNYIIPIRMLFQFLTDTALIDIDFKNFIEKNRNLRRRISLNDIVNLIYGDKKVFILHIDETQLLFDQKSVIEYKQDRRSSVQYKFLESIFQLTQPHSKIILPVLSGTNILATINSFLNSGFRYYPIYFELLRWNHFEKIIKDLFNDNNVTFPKIFRDMTELLVGHPRLFSSYITCASNCDEILSYSAKGNTNINWSVNSREDPRFFNKEGFRKFLSDLQRKEGIEKAWRAMHAVNTEFMRLMPETN